MNNKSLTKIISKNLIHFRKLFGMTQTELAERINYSDKSVSKWERGDGVPDIFVLTEIAEIFGVTVNDFLSEESMPKKKLKAPLTTGKKIIIALLSNILVWFVMTTLFVLLNFILSAINADFHSQWIVFIYAIPLMSIVNLVLSEVWKWQISSFLSVSTLIWSIGISIHLSAKIFDFPFQNSALVYLIPAVMQILVILWYILKYFKNKRI